MEDTSKISRIEGIWWIPDKPEEKIAGILTIDQEKHAVLSLLGMFGGLASLTGNFKADIIHGIGDKHIVTLCNAFTKKQGFNVPGINKQELYVNQILLGEHLNTETLLFDNVDISLDYLPEFCNQSGLSIKMDHEDNKIKGMKAEIKTQNSISIGDYNGIEIGIRFSWGQKGDNFRTIILYEKCFLTAKLKNKYSIDDIFKKIISPLQDFITLATDKPNALIKILLNNSKRNNNQDIELLQRTRPIKKRKEGEGLLRGDILFTLNDLNTDYIKNWFILCDEYQPVVNILFGQRYTKNTYLENMLLNGVSALEAYHRRKFTNNILDKREWKEKKKKIVESIPSEKDFINQILEHANEKRLKTRIEEVVEFSGLKENFVDNFKDWNITIRNYRNTLTHYDPSRPKEITDYNRLHWLSESLSWVILACLMREIGFSKEKVKELLKNNQRFLFAASMIKNSFS